MRHPLLLALLPFALLATRQEQAPAVPEGPESLDALLEPIRAEFELPALGGAILSGDELVAIGAVGKRRVDLDVEVTPADLWHFGSCTKSMTATWIALLVEAGELGWDTTIGEVYPELVQAEKIHPDWIDVPIEWLVQNRGGAPGNMNVDQLWTKLFASEKPPVEQRRQMVETLLAHPPAAEPGTKYIYSNAGFSIAAAMAETIVGEPWEERIRADLFEPLGMSSFGFGAPGVPGETLQPFGHRVRNGELRVVPLGPGDDNPSAIAPAGKAHGSLEDWSKYAALHLAGARGKEDLLIGSESFSVLHTPHEGDYAGGWVVRETDWAGSLVLWHNGSNTMWYCEIAIVPDEDFAILVTTNRGDGPGRKAAGKALRVLHAYALVKHKR